MQRAARAHARLSSLVLPENLGLARDHVAPPSARPEGYEERYDRLTFFYDAIYVEGRRSICLVCPKLLNLKRLVKEGEFRVGGQLREAAVRQQSYRHDEIWIPAGGPSSTLSFSWKDFEADVRVNAQESGAFQNRRCGVIKSTNNDLAWIRDWVRYHVEVHGMDAVLFFDNDSDRYEPRQILESLDPIKGLESVRVLSVPRPFGPMGKPGVWAHHAKFLQVAVLNIGRIRFLSTCASVLSCDLDELVAPIPGSSIFEETEKSRLGFRVIAGNWVVTEPGHKGPIFHTDHRYRVRTAASCPGKYCVVPGGPLQSLYWDIHGIHHRKAPLGRSLKWLCSRPDLEFWHCRSLTDYWKPQRRLSLYESAEELELDRKAVETMRSAF